jgi:cytochrome d ubiquinol oxidase subunit II
MLMLIEANIILLAITVLFFLLFAGVNFGSGLLQMITGEEDRITITDAIGPVWEISHLWLLFASIMLFVGFPSLFSTIAFYLSVPLLIVIAGTILRSTSFVYLASDAEGKSGAVYKWVFRFTSIVIPVFLGMILGAVTLGRIDTDAVGFYNIFIEPWLNLFSFSLGLFALALFVFLASVYMIGESKTDKEADAFSSAARSLNVISVAVGVFVFTSAELYGYPLFNHFMDSGYSIILVGAATLLVPVLWWALRSEKIWFSRLLASTQVASIMVAWFLVQMSALVRKENGSNLTFINSAASDSTLWQLFVVFSISMLIVLPLFLYLMKRYKGGMFYQEKRKVKR